MGAETDTRALQDAFDRATGGRSHRIVLEPRPYLLNRPIQLRGHHLIGLEVEGERAATRLIQLDPHAPIFSFRARALSHTNYFAGFSAEWAVPGSSETRVAFHFPSTGNTDFYNSSFERITVLGAAWAFRSIGPSFWGNRIVDLTVGGLGTAGVASFVPDHQTGQPNNYFEKHYVDCQGMEGPIYRGASLGAEMRAIEFNMADRGPVLIWDESGGDYALGHVRLETARFANPAELFHLPNGQLVADTVELVSIDVRAQLFLVGLNSNPLSLIDIRNVYIRNEQVAKAGSIRMVRMEGSGSPPAITIGRVFPSRYR